MKEIHAYQNDDGTYRVEIVNVAIATDATGRKLIEFIIPGRMEIPRADIQIIALKDGESSDEFLAFTIGE